MNQGKEILYLSNEDIRKVGMTMPEYIDSLQGAFAAKAEGKVQMPAASGPEPCPTGVVHAMSCYIEPEQKLGMKWLSVFFHNTEKGLPWLSGLIVLNNPETGFPLCVMNCVEVTHMRTGAVNGLFCRHLANPDAETVCVLGCGAEGRTNLEAVLCEAKNVKHVYAWAPRMPKVYTYCEEMSKKLNISVEPIENVEQAVRMADILIIAGPGGDREDNRVIEKDWLKKGCTILPVNQDSHFKRGVLASTMDKIFIDDITSFMLMKKRNHYDGIDEVPPDIGQVICNQVKGRENHDEIIMAIHRGIGLVDVAPAWEIMKRAEERNIGTYLPL